MIHKSLKDCYFISVSKEGKEPNIPKGKSWKDYKLNFEEANKELTAGFNVGLVCGPTKENYNILIIDCDSIELGEYCINELPRTYTEASTSGGMHFIFKLEEEMNINDKSFVNVNSDSKHFGEVRIKECYTVVAPSVAINKEGMLKPYEIVHSEPLATITEEQVISLLLHFNSQKEERTIKGLNSELLERVNNDSELKSLFETPVQKGLRSEKEQSLTNKLRSRDFTKEEVYHIVLNSAIGKMREKPLSYWSLMWEKALNYVTEIKKEYKPEAETEEEPLKAITFDELLKTKPLKGYVIEGLEKGKPILGIKENVLTYGDTTKGKSYLCIYQGLCVASGKNFLGKFRTKKQPVLYVSTENNQETDAERIRRLRKGLGLRSRKIPFHYLSRAETGSIFDRKFKNKLFSYIIKHKIKLLYIDTVSPVAPGIDNNNADDVTRVFNEFLKPLSDKLGVTTVYLHHTDKNNRDTLGSTKWRGSSDKTFRVDRKGLSPFIEYNDEKGRGGETANIVSRFEWGSDYTKVHYFSSTEPTGRKKQNKKMSQQELFILKLNELCSKSDERKTIQEKFKAAGIKFSPATLDRAINKWRVEE